MDKIKSYNKASAVVIGSIIAILVVESIKIFDLELAARISENWLIAFTGLVNFIAVTLMPKNKEK